MAKKETRREKPRRRTEPLTKDGEWLYVTYNVGGTLHYLAGRPGREGEPEVVWMEYEPD